MDFWDITKLLVRRWQVALPMLLLAAVLTIVTVGQVKPDYIATAYVQLVPPSPGTGEPGAVTADQRNPWIGQGLQTLGNAAIVQVLDQTVIDELKRTGYSDTYTVTMGQSTPLITFEIVGKSTEQAKKTADLLVNKFNSSIKALQQNNASVKDADMIKPARLDVGGNVKKSTSKVKRALVAVAGAGVLLTAGATIGVDAWLRRRRKTRFTDDERGSATSPLPLPPSTGLARASVNGSASKTDHDRSSVPVVAGAPSSSNASEAGLTVQYQRPTTWDREAIDKKDVPDADSTVIIPLSAMPPKPAAKRGKSS